jgi:hypothetical protein
MNQPERRRVCERAAIDDLIGALAQQDSLDGDFDDLARQRPGYLRNLDDVVRQVSRRAV